MSIPVTVSTSANARRPQQTSGRYRWMDTARGLAIVLVIIVHAGSMYGGAGLERPGWIVAMERAMSPYRMPLLIFLSGFLLDRSLRKGLGLFLYGKLRNILWPYLLWTVIYCLASMEPGRLLSPSPWLGGSYLWYMLFLGFYFVVAVIFARAPHLIIACWAIAISLAMPDASKYGERLFMLMGFFFFGAFAGKHLERFTVVLADKWSLALVPMAVALSVASALFRPYNYNPGYTIPILAAILGVCALLLRVQDWAPARALQFVGRRSIVYYAVHVPIYAVLIPLLSGAGVTSPYAVIPACLMLGILVPTVVAIAMDRGSAVELLFAAPDVVDFRSNPKARSFSRHLDNLKLLPPQGDKN